MQGFENIAVIEVDAGNKVNCDYCNDDYTDSTESGGLLFGSYAACPKCAPAIEGNAKLHQEADRIRARCPENKSFADWVRQDLRQ
jgi:hypothetical protein